jgi:hypothetical protein
MFWIILENFLSICLIFGNGFLRNLRQVDSASREQCGARCNNGFYRLHITLTEQASRKSDGGSRVEKQQELFSHFKSFTAETANNIAKKGRGNSS